MELLLEKKHRCTAVLGPFYSPSNDEVRQSNDEGANRHQYTAPGYYFWPVELGPKVTDKSYHQQVTWERGDRHVIILDFIK